jgi:hypothetical protein
MGLVIAGLVTSWWMLPIVGSLIGVLRTALPSLKTVMGAS